MLATIKTAAGIVLIIVCFIYILRRPGVSMRENVVRHKQEKLDQALARAESEMQQEAAPDQTRDED